MVPDEDITPEVENVPLPFDCFQHFAPSPERIVEIAGMRDAFRAAQLAIFAYCPPSRERSVALTELETTAMWAIKSIVIQDFLPPRYPAEKISGE